MDIHQVRYCLTDPDIPDSLLCRLVEDHSVTVYRQPTFALPSSSRLSAFHLLIIGSEFLYRNHAIIRKTVSEKHALLRILWIRDRTDPVPDGGMDDLIFLALGKNSDPESIHHAARSAFALLQLEAENHRLRTNISINASDIKKITRVGQALAYEHDFYKLIGLILDTARELASADGGSIYLVERKPKGEKPTHIRFMRSSMSLDADEFLLPINTKSIAGYVAYRNRSLVIDDVRKIPGTEEYSFNDEFDRSHHYYTKSMMVIPMNNFANEVIGVLQLVNRKRDFHRELTLDDMKGGEVIPFSELDYELASSLAGQATVAIENEILLMEQKELLESFIEVIANAIDAKSPYTGGHCKRVPIIAEMLTQALCDEKEGKFRDFHLTEEEWHELKIASWLHDSGKVVTPVHVMDKATKLETIFDRIELVRAKIEILRKEHTIRALTGTLEDANLAMPASLQRKLDDQITELNEIESFLQSVNTGGEYLEPEKMDRIRRIGRLTYTSLGTTFPLLSKDEVENLCISKGTLNDEERLIINGHMVETINMLESLPFPSNLRRVPEIAGGHHERMDGNGYPRGIFAGDMSVPARVMAIADVFEALTARDRPYKKAKKLSETMRIMGFMKKENHLDPDIFDVFVRSGVYRRYSEQYLSPEQIDFVDEQKLLAIRPDPYTKPPSGERQSRRHEFLPEYRNYRNLFHQVRK